MATYIMDPRASTDGTGSAASPWNTWASKTFSAGDSYLQVSGTRYTGALLCAQAGSAGSYIYFGAYGEGPKPIIDGAGGTARPFWAQASAHYVWVDGFEFLGGTTLGATTNYCATWGTSASPANYGRLTNCIMRDVVTQSASAFEHVGVNVFGTDFYMNNCEVYNILDDGIYIEGLRPTVTNNYVHDVGIGSKITADCLQLVNPGPYRVMWNHLDHSNVAEKQAFVTSGTVGGGLFAFNRVSMITVPGGVDDVLFATVYSGQPDDRIIGNFIEGGNYGIRFAGANADNQVAIANTIVGAEYGIAVSSDATNPTVLNNAFINCSIIGCYVDSTDATIHNNILHGNAVGLRRKSTAVFSHNCYYGNGTDSDWSGASGSAETNTIELDPMFLADYNLDPRSPCRRKGLAKVGICDRYGRVILGTPDIGPFQCVPARAEKDRAVTLA